MALLISRFRVQDIGVRVTVSRPGDPKVALRFGNSSFLENDDGTFTLTVRQRGKHPVSLTRTRDLELEMTAHFTQNTPGFCPPGAVLLDQRHLPESVRRLDEARVGFERIGVSIHAAVLEPSSSAGGERGTELRPPLRQQRTGHASASGCGSCGPSRLWDTTAAKDP